MTACVGVPSAAPSGVATPRQCPVAPFQAVGARSDPSLAKQPSLLPPTGSPAHGTASPGRTEGQGVQRDIPPGSRPERAPAAAASRWEIPYAEITFHGTVWEVSLQERSASLSPPGWGHPQRGRLPDSVSRREQLLCVR